MVDGHSVSSCSQPCFVLRPGGEEKVIFLFKAVSCDVLGLMYLMKHLEVHLPNLWISPSERPAAHAAVAPPILSEWVL